jgi:hypothetical protein
LSSPKKKPAFAFALAGLITEKKGVKSYALLRLNASSDPKPPTNAMIEDGSGTTTKLLVPEAESRAERVNLNSDSILVRVSLMVIMLNALPYSSLLVCVPEIIEKPLTRSAKTEDPLYLAWCVLPPKRPVIEAPDGLLSVSVTAADAYAVGFTSAPKVTTSDRIVKVVAELFARTPNSIPTSGSAFIVRVRSVTTLPFANVNSWAGATSRHSNPPSGLATVRPKKVCASSFAVTVTATKPAFAVITNAHNIIDRISFFMFYPFTYIR